MRTLTLPIRTERLNLREFVRSDFDAVFAYSSDPRVTRYLFFGPRDEDGTAEYLEGLLASHASIRGRVSNLRSRKSHRVV